MYTHIFTFSVCLNFQVGFLKQTRSSPYTINSYIRTVNTHTGLLPCQHILIAWCILTGSFLFTTSGISILSTYIQGQRSASRGNDFPKDNSGGAAQIHIGQSVTHCISLPRAGALCKTSQETILWTELSHLWKNGTNVIEHHCFTLSNHQLQFH